MSSAPLKVLYVLKKYPRLSETFILNEILGLEATGCEVSIFSLTPADEGRFHADLARVKADVKYAPAFGAKGVESALSTLAASGARLEFFPRAMRYIERIADDKRINVLLNGLFLAELVKRKHIDHVHAHFMTVAAHTAYVAHLFTGVPFSVTSHAKDIYRETVDVDMYAETARASKAVVTVSNANRDFIAEKFLAGQGQKIRVIYNGLPLEDIMSEPEEVRDPHLLLGVGRFVEKKGFDLFLESIAMLRRSGEKIRGVLVGDGEDRAKLERKTKDLGLESVVTFTGPLPRAETLSWMRRARVLSAPCVVAKDGNQDALPTVLLEALSVGCPVVSTPVGGIREIVDDGVHGIICPENDVAALASATARLLHDEAFWRRASAAGKIRARERFDRARTLPALVDVFRKEGASHGAVGGSR